MKKMGKRVKIYMAEVATAAAAVEDEIVGGEWREKKPKMSYD